MKRIMRAGLTILLCAVLVYSIARIVLIQAEYRSAAAIYEESRAANFHIEEVLPSPQAPTQTPAPEQSAGPDLPPEEEAGEYFPQAYADLEALAQINPDVVGWLWIQGTDISYPLLQGKDNQKYLNTSYNLKRSSSGSIFMDFRSPSDFSGDNTIIYGHNMKNGAMFGTLKDFADADYRDDHEFVYLFLSGEVLKYRVFAAYHTHSTSESYTRNFSGDMGFENFMDYIAASAQDMAAQPDAPVGLLTLSTCTSGARTERFVLHAALVATKAAENEP